MEFKKKNLCNRVIAVFLCLLMIFSSAPLTFLSVFAEGTSTVDNSPRLELNFNKNWKFHLGDVSSAYLKAYSDSAWESVDLPHDFSISQNFTTSGSVERESGMLPGGTGWYRKSFALPAEYADKTVILNFDGVYSQSEIYINGTLVGSNRYGYNSFSFDISDYLVCDGTTANLVAVKAMNPIPTSRWYSGSGITRDVTLTIVNDVHVSLYGTQVTTPNLASSSGSDGTTNAVVTLQNDGTAAKTVTVNTSVLNASGSAVASASASVTLAAGATQNTTLTMSVSNPALWSTETPVLYTLHTQVLDGTTVLDEYDTTFGYRWINWDASTGFSLNGTNMKLQGVCLHHDQGALGAAQEYDALYRQLSIMKDMGVNSVRTSHNTASRVFLEVCNELGILVMEEFFDGWSISKNDNTNDFSVYFSAAIGADNEILGGDEVSAWYEFVVKQTLKRDRNDPSIIIWDAGNEIGYRASDFPTIASNIASWIHAMDDRPVTEGNNTGSITGDLYLNVDTPYMDVIGANYYPTNWISNHSSITKPFVGTETASSVNSRGVYSYPYSYTSESRYKIPYAHSTDYQINSYDGSCVSWGDYAAEAWYYTIVNDWFSGEYVWTGFDYIGEPTPWWYTDSTSYAYPNSSYFGIVDTAGFAKDSYYLYRSFWQNDGSTTLHLLPGTWNQSSLFLTSGYANVAVYSNAPVIKLYYDGVEIASATATTHTTAANYQYQTYTESVTNASYCKIDSPITTSDFDLYAQFQVLYDANKELSVKAFEADGVTEITDTVGTNFVKANSASQIDVSVWNNKTTLTADGDSFRYLEIEARDAEGNFVNDYNGTLNITLTGAGEIVGVDNGNAATTEKFQQASVLTSDTTATVQMFNGKALVIVKSTEETGNINVTVTPADSLAAKSVNLTSLAETGDELTDEFEEVVDQTALQDAISKQEQKELLLNNISSLEEPASDASYTQYALGSASVTALPTGSYILANTDGSSVLTNDLSVTGAAPAANSDTWYFSRQADGTYVISFTGQNVTNEYLNISASGLSVSGSSQNLMVTLNNDTVTISSEDGSAAVTLGTAGTSTSASGTALSLYTVSGGNVSRYTVPGIVEDAQYIIYGKDLSGNYYAMSPTAVTYSSSRTGVSRASATVSDGVCTTDAANEYTFTKIAGTSDEYYIQNSEGKYLAFDTSADGLVYFSDTPVSLHVGQYSSSDISISSNGHYLDLFNTTGIEMFSQWSNTSASDPNEHFALYKLTEAASEETVALYNALQSGIAVNAAAYTEESYNTLLNALQAGYDTYTDAAATDAQEQAAAATITDAIDALEAAAVSPTLTDDISSLTPAVEGDGEHYELYTAAAGTPIPDGEYIIYSTDASSNSFVMSGTATTASSKQGFTRTTGTVSGTTIETDSSNEWTFTYNTATGNYTIQNASGKYLNISSTTQDTATLSDTANELSVSATSDGSGKVNIYNTSGTGYLQNQNTSGSAMFTGRTSTNGTATQDKMTLYRKVVGTSAEKVALYNALVKGNAASSELYTEKTYNTLRQALQTGYNVYTDDSASEEQITAATQAIEAAYAALKLVSIRPQLQEQINNLEEPEPSDESIYAKYTANYADSEIPDGDYILYGSTNLTNSDGSPNGAWGVMTNQYVSGNFTSSWYTSSGFSTSQAAATPSSPTWHFEKIGTDSSGEALYNISYVDSSGVRQYLWIDAGSSNNNYYLRQTSSNYGADGNDNVKFYVRLQSDGTVKILCYAYPNKKSALNWLGSSAGYTAVSAYDGDGSSNATSITLYKTDGTTLYPWNAPVENGAYLITDETGASSGTTYVLKASEVASGRAQRVNETISSDNKITTETAYQLNFQLVPGTTNQYYITNAQGQYLTLDASSYNQSSASQKLTYTTTPTALYVTADSDGNVVVYTAMPSSTTNYLFIDHYKDLGYFSTWDSTLTAALGETNRVLTLYRYEKNVETSAKQELYNALQDGIAIEPGLYTDESFGNLLLALKDGVEVYNAGDSTDEDYREAAQAIRDAIAALKLASSTFKATLYKYGYNQGDGNYNYGGKYFNTQSIAAMEAIIRGSDDLMGQIEDYVRQAMEEAGATLTDAQVEAAVELGVQFYARAYTLSFTGTSVGTSYQLGGGSITNTANYYETFWNHYQKTGTQASDETSPQGASTQGIFSTTLVNGYPGSHELYSDELSFFNTYSGFSSESQFPTGWKYTGSNGTAVYMKYPPLKNISVYVPDFFSRQDVLADGETSIYSKYYWDMEFPFTTATNSYGITTYTFDSDAQTVQAAFDDENHTAEIQVTDEANTVTSSGSKTTGFYPFNYQLDGTNADMSTTESAIYHFGMSFSTDFYLPTAGTYADGEDIVFEFKGDDDVLVYIDDVLILDNAGIHGARSTSINFTEKSVSYQFIADAGTNSTTNPDAEGITYTYGAENSGISAQNQAALDYLNLIANDGKTHTFSFFYLERGSGDSNMYLKFNIQKLSDYLSLVDDDYVLDYGLPVNFNAKTNNVVASDAADELEYEYVGIAHSIPDAANSGLMFTEPAQEDVTFFGEDGTLEYEGQFGVFNVSSDGTVVYTPNTFSFTNVDTLYLVVKVVNDPTYADDTVYYAFEYITMIPAASIYFEDDFEGSGITFTDGAIPDGQDNAANYGIWLDVGDTNKETVYQHADMVGAADAYHYGYDEAYADCATYSNESAKVVTVSMQNNPNAKYSGGDGASWPTARFSFAGTGFDLISLTSNQTGAVNVRIMDSTGNAVRNNIVNNYYGYRYGQLYADTNGNATLSDTGTPLYATADGTYSLTPMYYDTDGNITAQETDTPAYAEGWLVDPNADNDLYQIPVIKVTDLDYGTYNVVITPMYSTSMDVAKHGQYDFYLDAIRIYNPAGEGSTLNNQVISYAYTADKEAHPNYCEVRNMLIGTNTLTNVNTVNGVVFIDGVDAVEDVSQYTSVGPNNEVYLMNNQAIAFEIWASRVPDDIQMAAKAVNQTNPTMTITYGTSSSQTAITSATDMYYSLSELLPNLTWSQVLNEDGTAYTDDAGLTYVTTGTIVIQNTSLESSILSVTNLKWTFPAAGIGAYNNKPVSSPSAQAEEELMLMSSQATFAAARTSLLMLNADLAIEEEAVAVENNVVNAGDSVVIHVTTSTDVASLVIRDADGNIVTPDVVEGFVASVDDEEVVQWTVTLSDAAPGTYTYTIQGAYENGYTSDDAPAVITVTVESAEESSFFEKLVGFFTKLMEFFKKLVNLFSGIEG